MINEPCELLNGMVHAVFDYQLDVLKVFLDKEWIDPGYADNYLIQWVCYEGFFEALELLLKHKKVDPRYAVSISGLFALT